MIWLLTLVVLVLLFGAAWALLEALVRRPSTTTITLTAPGQMFTQDDVGKTMHISGVGDFIVGRVDRVR